MCLSQHNLNMFIIPLFAKQALKIAPFCSDREIMISVLGVVAPEDSQILPSLGEATH